MCNDTRLSRDPDLAHEIQQVIDSIPANVFWYHDDTFIGCNQHLAEILGTTPVGIIGKKKAIC